MTRLARATGSRPVLVLAVLLGAGLVLLAAGRTWVSEPVHGVPGLREVRAGAGQVAPGVPAVGLVIAAGGVALALAGRTTRVVVAALIALAGLGVLGLVWSVRSDPVAALAPSLTSATGQVGGSAGAGPASVSWWPWLAVAGAALAAVGAVLALLHGRSWGTGAGRYQRAPGPGPGGPGGPGGPAGRPDGDRDAERDARLDVWDALSRGEDPTE